MKRWLWRLSWTVLVLLYCLALAAPFIAPYTPRRQFRDLFYHPPTPVTFRGPSGEWHMRPVIPQYERLDLTPRYEAVSRTVRLSWFTEGDPYQWLGMTWRTHLFGPEDASAHIFLLGTDALGRDLFSRILYGARFSLTLGVVSVAMTVILGTFLGAIAGYFGGWADTVLMRLVDLFLSIPPLFLILAIRGLTPLRLETLDLYWIMAGVFALAGWASITRVVRGQVVSLKHREYVLAARVAGASDWRILRRHILPFTTNYLLVQSTVLIPAFILGEITLSFLGVGVQEPDPSWGNLLTAATSLRAMSDFPWLLSPVAFIFITVAAFNLIGDQLKVLDKEARQWW